MPHFQIYLFFRWWSCSLWNWPSGESIPHVQSRPYKLVLHPSSIPAKSHQKWGGTASLIRRIIWWYLIITLITFGSHHVTMINVGKTMSETISHQHFLVGGIVTYHPHRSPWYPPVPIGWPTKPERERSAWARCCHGAARICWSNTWPKAARPRSNSSGC